MDRRVSDDWSLRLMSRVEIKKMKNNNLSNFVGFLLEISLDQQQE